MTRLSGAAALAAIAGAAMALAACGKRHEPDRAPFVPIAEVEGAYGPLIGAANHPTPDQNGNGERVGLFRDAGGDVWGLPISIGDDATVLACAPPALRQAKVTDSFAAGSSIAGSTNSPTGWRGGTGDLELLLRDARGTLYSQGVNGADLPSGVMCWNPARQGIALRLHYYRLTPSVDRSR